MTEELDRSDLDAWVVEPLPDDFDARVLAAWDRAQPSARRARSHAGWMLAVSLAAASVLAIVLWPRAEADDGVSLRASASAQVTYVPGSGRAEQTAGTVTYVVPTRTPFVVHTPAAEIAVHGTEFTVEMLTMNDERRRYLGAGALALGGAAVAVYVSAGEVEVRNAHGRMQVAPTQTAVASEYAAPQTEPAPIVAETTPKARPRAKLTAAQRKDVQRRLADALARRSSAPSRAAPGDKDAVDEPVEQELGKLEKDYIREVMFEDLFPLAKECYDNALASAPALGGRVVMSFSIVGDESVGGLVEEVAFGDAEAFEHPQVEHGVPAFPLAEHPEFAECMRESAASVLFDPPEGGGRVTVTFPMTFALDNGGSAQPED